jgi:hypothetical protein
MMPKAAKMFVSIETSVDAEIWTDLYTRKSPQKPYTPPLGIGLMSFFLTRWENRNAVLSDNHDFCIFMLWELQCFLGSLEH